VRLAKPEQYGVYCVPHARPSAIETELRGAIKPVPSFSGSIIGLSGGSAIARLHCFGRQTSLIGPKIMNFRQNID
jgi:hypothetical protein